MPAPPILYYITSRCAFPGGELARRSLLLDKIAEAATHGVDYIQLREKDLPARDLEHLAGEAIRILRDLRTRNPALRTAFLINSRTDVALATNSSGVHLPANDITPQEIKAAWHGTRDRDRTSGSASLPREISEPLISVSCHSPEDVSRAAANRATLALFAPVFEKPAFPRNDAPGTTPAGLAALSQVCRASIPVLALGGVTLQNARSCLQAGAAGIASIRLFQENDIATIVASLRGSH